MHADLLFLATVVEETVLSPGICFSSLVIEKLVVDAWIEFWSLYFVPLVYTSIFVSMLGFFDSNCPVLCLEICYCDASSLFLFYKLL